jgi:hypothetical protein
MSKDADPFVLFGLSPLELARIAPLPECAQLAGCSVDTLERHHADKILRVSPRRVGMRVRDALLLATSKKKSV